MWRKAFEGENVRVSVQNENFAEKYFVDCSSTVIIWVRPQNVAEKTFTDGSETAKVFSQNFSAIYIYIYIQYKVYSYAHNSRR